MSRNDAKDYAQKLYSRVPAHYRVYDVERGYPLLALLRVVGEQVANIRLDLDALWDNFFIETCDDWVVPYISALVGTNMLENPVGQSNRLDVKNTVRWRRSKGTPAMLQELAQAISLWPTDVAEFFKVLGWSQNVNHLRLEAPLTPDLRDPYQLSLLGHAADSFAHAADFKPACVLDAARVTPNSLGIGHSTWGTEGRYQVKNLGFFVRRLQTFALKGVTPAAVEPGGSMPDKAACFTFDPLFRNIPLFVEETRIPLSRAAFDHAPYETFGKDVSVRQFGVLLATDTAPSQNVIGDQTTFNSPRSLTMSSGVLTQIIPSNEEPFTFGGAGAGLALHATEGMRLLNVYDFQPGSKHFIISAHWNDVSVTLGSISTFHAARRDGGPYYKKLETASGPGQLIITVQTGHAKPEWPTLPPAAPAYFPGAVLAMRAERPGAWHAADALYVYLPPAPIKSYDPMTYYVADDGSTYKNDSTYTTSTFDATRLARASEGQIYPARALTASTEPATGFTLLNRNLPAIQTGTENPLAGGLRLFDSARLGTSDPHTEMLIEANLYTKEKESQKIEVRQIGAIATTAIDHSQSDYPELFGPDSWLALTYRPSKAAVSGNLPTEGLLSIYLKPLKGGDFIPQTEVIVTNRVGQSLLVYLPEVSGVSSDGIEVFVADDGSTYFAKDDVEPSRIFEEKSFSSLTLARASAGQVLPIPGVWPLQQRRPVAINLCSCERNTLLRFGELGIDPELGRFALPSNDPTISQGGSSGLSVDYVEAFSDSVGVRTFDRKLDPKKPPTRLVAQSGDALSPLNSAIAYDHIHSSVKDALENAEDDDVIEIVDSATYAMNEPIKIPETIKKTLILRAAAEQRPCLTFYQSESVPTPDSFVISSPLDGLELNGLLISGGPIAIKSKIKDLQLIACTLDPSRLNPASPRTTGSFWAGDDDSSTQTRCLFCRCITGGVYIGSAVSQLIVADSIIDQRGGLAIGGAPPSIGNGRASESVAQSVQLERVTVFGRILCEVLNASESLLDDTVTVYDQQAGCIRFSRYERGSVLPRRYHCVPSDDQAGACSPKGRCLAPQFNSRTFGRPDYAQLASACPQEIQTASEAGAEVGAFAGSLNTIRLRNLEIKLQEFLPVGLSALVIAET